VGETLPPEVRLPLEQLDVWAAFLKAGHSLAHGICACWGHNEPGYNDFITNPYGPGWHVDRRCFDANLAAVAAARGIDLFCSTRFIKCERCSAGYAIQARNSREILALQAGLVVDATGRRSALAGALGVKKLMFDQLVGVYGFFWAAKQPLMDTFTLIEAGAEGWWYSAPLPDGRLAVAFMSDSDIVSAKKLGQPENWLTCLQQTDQTRTRLARLDFTGERLRVYPAQSFRLEVLSGAGWLAVGDAACAYDPLSGQGVCQALHSGLAAAQAITTFWQGDKEALLAYAARLAKQFQQYLLTRRDYYALERRWPRSIFWQRRQN
jgi:flavin-dependent dehydrogenase